MAFRGGALRAGAAMPFLRRGPCVDEVVYGPGKVIPAAGSGVQFFSFTAGTANQLLSAFAGGSTGPCADEVFYGPGKVIPAAGSRGQLCSFAAGNTNQLLFAGSTDKAFSSSAAASANKSFSAAASANSFFAAGNGCGRGMVVAGSCADEVFYGGDKVFAVAGSADNLFSAAGSSNKHFSAAGYRCGGGMALAKGRGGMALAKGRGRAAGITSRAFCNNIGLIDCGKFPDWIELRSLTENQLYLIQLIDEVSREALHQYQEVKTQKLHIADGFSEMKALKGDALVDSCKKMGVMVWRLFLTMGGGLFYLGKKADGASPSSSL